MGVCDPRAVEEEDREAAPRPVDPRWGDTFHVTPGDVHVKHFLEPNDRDYES
jgi:hypothetical protein